MKKITLIAFMLITALSYAQVGVNTNNPDASSALDIQSTTGGILIPRLTKTQRDAILAPATGLMIYQTDQASGFYFYNETAWIKIDGVAGPPGPIGNTGPQGVQGEVGAAGVPGTNGTNGVDGQDGTQGVQGEAGADGQGGITEATYGLTLTGSGTQNDPYLISLPTGGSEGQVLKIENGVPFWTDLCSNIYYRDLDSDSYGNNLDSITFCDPPVGYVIDNTDCDDSDASIHPGATEIDDDIDNNCDGVIDEGLMNRVIAMAFLIQALFTEHSNGLLKMRVIPLIEMAPSFHMLQILQNGQTLLQVLGHIMIITLKKESCIIGTQ